MNQFQIHHTQTILQSFQNSSYPLDLFLRKYFLIHKAAGSKDRQNICQAVYSITRWQGLIDYHCEKPVTWQRRVQIFLEKFQTILHEASNQSIAPHIRVSFPKDLFDFLLTSYTQEEAIQFCLNSNQPAPTTVRANVLKIPRDELIERWKLSFNVKKTLHSNYGIVFTKRENFLGMKEFKEGLFEVQDEGSQIVADHVDVKPGEHVLDFCAGSGGKTLAFAHKMHHRGQIYLYDNRPFALEQARIRLKRAGIQNFQILEPDKLKKPGMQKRMDWILLDVPCSGSGTLRRNPDMKWRFQKGSIDRLVTQQRLIFAEALPLLHDEGTIVYATCSVFPDENMKQIEFFIKEFGMKLVQDPFFSLPQQESMDGFFAAVLKKK